MSTWNNDCRLARFLQAIVYDKLIAAHKLTCSCSVRSRSSRSWLLLIGTVIYCWWSFNHNAPYDGGSLKKCAVVLNIYIESVVMVVVI